MFDEAERLLDKFSNVTDENMDFLKGIVSFHIGKLNITKNIFLEFIDKYPHSELLPNVQFYLAKIFLENSDYDDALKSIKHSIALKNNNAEFHKLESELYFKKEMYYHANESINRALKLNPSVVEWRHFQIKILVLLDEIKKAKDKLSNSIDESDSSAEILHLIGNWYLKNKDIPEANKYFEIAKGINSQDSK
jgi:tetratricopeptide (TPR) repeat protein